MVAEEVKSARSEAILEAMAAAKTAFGCGQYDLAIEELDRVIAEDAMHSPAMAWRMLTLVALGKFEQVADIFRRELIFTFHVDERRDASNLKFDLCKILNSADFFQTSRENVPLFRSELSFGFLDRFAEIQEGLRDFTLSSLTEYLTYSEFGELFRSRQPAIDLQIWANRVLPGGRIGAHYHPRSWLSCVYYPCPNEVGEGSPEASLSLLEFGRIPDTMGGGSLGLNFEYSPKGGSMIMFPSYYFHSVRENKSSNSRLSIGIDIVVV